MIKATFKYLGFVLAFVILFSSCSTSKDVVSDSRIQKRKYTKGYFFNIGKNDNNVASNPQEVEETKPADDVVIVELKKKEPSKRAQKKEEVAVKKQVINSKKEQESDFKNEAYSEETTNTEKKSKNNKKASKVLLEKVWKEKDLISFKDNSAAKETMEPNDRTLGRQGLILILAGLLIEIVAGILGIGILGWIGGIVILVGLILIILHLLNSL